MVAKSITATVPTTYGCIWTYISSYLHNIFELNLYLLHAHSIPMECVCVSRELCHLVWWTSLPGQVELYMHSSHTDSWPRPPNHLGCPMTDKLFQGGQVGPGHAWYLIYTPDNIIFAHGTCFTENVRMCMMNTSLLMWSMHLITSDSSWIKLLLPSHGHTKKRTLSAPSIHQGYQSEYAGPCPPTGDQVGSPSCESLVQTVGLHHNSWQLPPPSHTSYSIM